VSGSPSQKKGTVHENSAADWLVARGFRIVERNYRCKMGELDIIALSDPNTRRKAQPTLHFVEVRYRKNNRFGGAAASVTLAKQQRLRRTAALFLHSHPPFSNHRAQFDVITITGTNYPPEIDWIAAAF